jgi:hypothetical protein
MLFEPEDLFRCSDIRILYRSDSDLFILVIQLTKSAFGARHRLIIHKIHVHKSNLTHYITSYGY